MSNANLGFLYYKDYYTRLRLAEKEGNEPELKKKAALLTQNRKWTDIDKKILLGVDEKNVAKNENGFSLLTTYPGLLVGAGYEHEIHTKEELKLGFYFDHTTGMPIIPGSAVKGALRAAFPQWNKHKKASHEIKEAKTQQIYRWLHPAIDFDTIDPAEARNEVQKLEDAIFEGLYDENKLGIYNSDIFYDAVIVKASTHLPTIDRILGTDSITPHIHEGMTYEAAMLKNPVPLPFIKVLPGITFLFQFDLKDTALPKKAKLKLFENILLTYGIGAKTNVGYGQFEPPPPTLNEYDLPEDFKFHDKFEKGSLLKGVVSSIVEPGKYKINVFLRGNYLVTLDMNASGYILVQNQIIAVDTRNITQGKLTAIKLHIPQ